MARPRETPAIKLAQKYKVPAKMVRKIWRKGMSNLALKCCINEAKRNTFMEHANKRSQKRRKYFKEFYRKRKEQEYARTGRIGGLEPESPELLALLERKPISEHRVTWLELSAGRSNS